MMAELRSALVLLIAVLFFLLIVGVLAIGSIMRPARWSERARIAL